MSGNRTAAARLGHNPSTGSSGDGFASGMALLLAMVVAQRGIGFLRNLWFCRILSPDELGQWNLAFNLTVLGAPLFAWGLPGCFGRYAEYFRQQGQLAQYLRRTLAITLALAVVGILTLLLAGGPAAWLLLGDSELYPLLVTVGVCLFVVIGFNALTEICTAVRQVRWVAVIQFANSLVFAVLSAALLCWTSWGATAVVIAYGLACLTTGILAYSALARAGYLNHGTSPDLSYRVYWQKTVAFAFGIWASNLATNLFNATDRFMIVHFAGPSHDSALTMVGQYHSSRILGELLMSVGLLVSSILVPYLTRDWERGNRRSVGCWINFSIKTVGITLFGASTAAMFVAPWLFQTVLAGKFADGLIVMPITLAACIVFATTAITQTYLLCAERSRRIPIAYGVGILVCISLTYATLPRYGLPAVVWSSLAANAVTLLVVVASSLRAGFRISSGAIVVMFVPLLLPMGAPFCLVLLIAILVSRGLQNQVFSVRERKILRDRWQAAVARFRTVPIRRHELALASTPRSS